MVLGGLLAVAVLATWPALARQPTIVDGLMAVLLGVSAGIALLRMAGSRAYRPAALLCFSAVLGHLGFMLGLLMDFGAAGLLLLAAWCGSQESAGWISVAQMVGVAPLGHFGMLIGCNLGMLLAGCDRLYFGDARPSKVLVLFICNVGMILGMTLAIGLWPLDNSASLSTIGLLIAVQMLLSMLTGMLAALLALSFFTSRLKQSSIRLPGHRT